MEEKWRKDIQKCEDTVEASSHLLYIVEIIWLKMPLFRLRFFFDKYQARN